MWRFLNSISRAIKSNVHSPRPSAGLYVEEEQEALELNEKVVCPFTGRRRRRSLDTDEHRGCSAKVLNSLFACKRNKTSDHHETTVDIKESENFNTGKEDDHNQRQSCHYDFWGIFQGTHRMLEALSWGSAVLLGADTERRRYKSRLLLRVLFTTPGNYTTIRSVKSGTGINQVVLQQQTTSQIAIKDPTGAAQDAAVNNLEAETLDSALEEFQSMCTEYTAKTESLLGIEAAGHGDFNTAVEHLRSSCALGNMSACFNLGLCYETGSGVHQDLDKARHYYGLAAIEGHSMALYNLGLMIMKCSNYNTEEKLASASCNCGCNKVEGLGLLEKAANLGLAEAQTYLGIHHIQENHDMDRAVPYFKAAAQQNDIEAQYFLAICYEQGLGVEANECRAAQLYSQAASAGHDLAMYNLAIFNEHGLGGLPQDKSSAIDLYQKSAELGCEQAKQRLDNIKTSETEQTATDDWKMKVETFRQLYLQYHKDDNTHSGHHHTTTLSPSASSPNLTKHFHKDIPFFFGDHPAGIMQNNRYVSFDPIDDSRGGLKTRNFHLGSNGDYDDDDSILSPHSKRSGADESFESITFDIFPSLKSMHKSQSHPNFSLVACNI